MIHPYEWVDYRILLTVRNRIQSQTFLLNQIPQSEFLEHWMDMWEADRERKILEMSIMTLTKESYDVLEPLYTGQYLLE
jgi:hypothetical protein